MVRFWRKRNDFGGRQTKKITKISPQIERTMTDAVNGRIQNLTQHARQIFWPVNINFWDQNIDSLEYFHVNFIQKLY